MKHIRPTSDYHYQKALNGPKKVLKQKDMITVEDALLFSEWLHERYTRINSFWTYKNDNTPNRPYYTTRELWHVYQRFLGKKATTQSKT